MSLLSRMIVGILPIIPRPFVGFVAKRYVAGVTLEQAIAKVRSLHDEGAVATMDVLGESVSNLDQAQEFVAEYITLLDRIHQENLHDTTVSLKPTMLGLGIDESFCADSILKIVGHAKELGIHITIDMEDHTATDATLNIYRSALEQHGNVGTVLQAYMRRTLSDIESLPSGPGHIRLCKGIYIEPREIAWKDFDTIRANFVSAIHKLMRRGIYTCIATHDEHLVWAGMSAVDKYELKQDQYEFQMLLGVDPPLRRIIINAGHKLRVYVPYGKHWYAYSIRRLRENPEIGVHIFKALFGIKGRNSRG